MLDLAHMVASLVHQAGEPTAVGSAVGAVVGGAIGGWVGSWRAVRKRWDVELEKALLDHEKNCRLREYPSVTPPIWGPR